jgi:hypothetical protein
MPPNAFTAWAERELREGRLPVIVFDHPGDTMFVRSIVVSPQAAGGPRTAAEDTTA